MLLSRECYLAGAVDKHLLQDADQRVSVATALLHVVTLLVLLSYIGVVGLCMAYSLILRKLVKLVLCL